MEKFIKNDWQDSPRGAYEYASILEHTTHPEGVDLWRLQCTSATEVPLDASVGHIVSPLSGSARLAIGGSELRLGVGAHLYLPRGCRLSADERFAAVIVSAGTPEQSAGGTPIVRDEEFLRRCANEGPLRWMLTPQYLSRRIFLHHDRTLLSRAGHPLSWFRTTMFDVRGLPTNHEGHPVFKMSYNYRTEPNVLVDVEGDVKVRMAEHPYGPAQEQAWGPWTRLTDEHTYHLNEEADGPEVEWIEGTNEKEARRNKHEVSIVDGHATLFCLFDPSPTGAEEHREGDYSDYGPLEQVLGTAEYQAHLERIRPFDAMVDELSWARARGTLPDLEGTPVWELAEAGRRAQLDYERDLHARLTASDPERARVIAPWMSPQ